MQRAHSNLFSVALQPPMRCDHIVRYPVEMTEGTEGIRLLVDVPHPGESIQSVIRRAAEVYRTSAYEMWVGTTGTSPPSDPDAPTNEQLLKLAKALGVSPVSLRSHVLEPGPAWLAADAREAVCPVCLTEDLAKGHSRYRRLAWNRALSTFCTAHRFPLCLPRINVFSAPGSYFGRFERSVIDSYDSLSEASRSLLQYICHLEEEFLGAADRPPAAIRRALAGVLAPDPDRGRLCILDLLVTQQELKAWVKPKRPGFPQPVADPWLRFVSEIDPSVRRAAIWVGLSRTAELDPRFSPDVWE